MQNKKKKKKKKKGKGKKKKIIKSGKKSFCFNRQKMLVVCQLMSCRYLNETTRPRNCVYVASNMFRVSIRGERGGGGCLGAWEGSISL